MEADIINPSFWEGDGMRELKVADNMRELRIANGYSQKFISQLIHIARQTYSLYETGKRFPDLL